MPFHQRNWQRNVDPVIMYTHCQHHDHHHHYDVNNYNNNNHNNYDNNHNNNHNNHNNNDNNHFPLWIHSQSAPAGSLWRSPLPCSVTQLWLHCCNDYMILNIFEYLDWILERIVDLWYIREIVGCIFSSRLYHNQKLKDFVFVWLNIGQIATILSSFLFCIFTFMVLFNHIVFYMAKFS